MSGTRGEDKKNPRVVIQDIVVASRENTNNPPPHLATGEFGKPEAFGGIMRTSTREDPDALIDRMHKQIDVWVQQAVGVHRKYCVPGSAQLLPGKENSVTRLLTNEFFFYTKEPLTIQHFEKLMQRLVDLAKLQPGNLHLLLGSFAVRTPDNKIMNVVPQIECGAQPNINFIVKNNPSPIDPDYSEKTSNKPFAPSMLLPNIDAAKGDKVDKLGIHIDGKRYPLSFNNVFLCKTAGGISFHSCIDICLDHGMAVAKKTLDQQLQADVKLAEQGEKKALLPVQCAHAIISNHTSLCPIYFLGDVTQADPKNSHHAAKHDMPASIRYTLTQSTFGTPADVIVMPPVYCATLPAYELGLVNYYNELQAFIADYKGQKTELADEIKNRYAVEHRHLSISIAADKEITLRESASVALVFSVMNNNFELTKYFLDNKVDPNTVNESGDSLLFLAISNRNSKMVALLLAYEANPHKMGKNGNAYDFALKIKNDETRQQNVGIGFFDRDQLNEMAIIMKLFDQVDRGLNSKEPG